MGPVSGIVVYILCWWVTLFAVLPWGVRQPDQPEVGSVGAPKNPNLKAKFLATTLISAILWVIIYILIDIRIIDFREMAKTTPIGQLP